MQQGRFLTPHVLHPAWGAVEEIVGNAPAAGANWKFTFPGGFMWRLISLHTILKNSAQAAERGPGVVLKNANGRTYYLAHSRATPIANESRDVSIIQDGSTGTTEKYMAAVLGIPVMLFPPEWVIEGTTIGLQTEDKYDAPTVLLEAFDPDQHRPRAELIAEVHEVLMAREAIRIATS